MLLCILTTFFAQYDGKTSRLRAVFSLQKLWPLLSVGSWLSITGRRKDDDVDTTYLQQHPEIDPPNHIAVIMVVCTVFDIYANLWWLQTQN